MWPLTPTPLPTIMSSQKVTPPVGKGSRGIRLPTLLMHALGLMNAAFTAHCPPGIGTIEPTRPHEQL